MTGALILVVGPSGAGKDSLLSAARKHFADNTDIVFPKRVITREADAGGERHQAVTPATFQAMREAGAFAFDWQAHGLDYGVPNHVQGDIDAGKSVVVNVSRQVVDPLRQSVARLWVLSITVDPKCLEQRLIQRGREDAKAIKKRLDRAAAYSLTGPDVISIENNTALADAIDAFTKTIAGIHNGGA